MTINGANPTSYFSAPAETLDPILFQGRTLRSQIRDGIVSLLNDFLAKHYRHSEAWAHPWLAGSGVSYQWRANRQPGDLDCLVGVDFIQFRKANPEYVGLSDNEISSQINEQFYDELQPTTSNWNGFELTFYVNPLGNDIRNLRPYAAYDLKYNEWTVTPDPNAAPPKNPSWDTVVENDRKMTEQITSRFNAALQDMQETRSGAGQRNAEVRLTAAYQQGGALYEEIHGNRSQAFSPTGQGYADFHNYRWQAGKRAGTVSKLRDIKNYINENSRADAQASYGVELPDANTLIRRAATYRVNK
jgi:hypothetical protein